MELWEIYIVCFTFHFLLSKITFLIVYLKILLFSYCLPKNLIIFFILILNKIMKYKISKQK